jgi:hypothetical protein
VLEHLGAIALSESRISAQRVTFNACSSQRLIGGAFLARPVDTAGMPKRPSPDKSQPTPLSSWDIYKVAKKAVWLGTVEAPDNSAAIEKAAKEFKAEAWRLYAVPRR